MATKRSAKRRNLFWFYFKFTFFFVASFFFCGMASFSQTSGVVVWEWEERPTLWIPYEVDVCQYLEKSFLKFTQGTAKKTSTVNLGKCSPGLSCYDVDLVNMEQQRIGTGKQLCFLILYVSFINILDGENLK